MEHRFRRSDVRVAPIFAWVISVLCAAIGFADRAAAQADAKSYPNQPIHIVVPFAAGGATDVTVRLIAQKLTEEWGATVIIENKPGATGAIAAEYVAKAKPDGYTLLMGTGSVNSVFPAVKKNLPFDTLRDFVAISNFFVTPNILVVHPSVPAQNVAEFIAQVKEGTLRALGVTSLQRDPLAPGVPAVAETLPRYDATSWAGLLAPAKTPPEIVEKLSAAVQRAIKQPDIVSKFQAISSTPVGDSSEHFAKFIKDDIA